MRRKEEKPSKVVDAGNAQKPVTTIHEVTAWFLEADALERVEQAKLARAFEVGEGVEQVLAD